MAGLVCLPRILKQEGFRTLYFHSYPSLKFYNLDVFMKSIGFDELHAADIMRPEDTILSWGYPEDVFYQRVFEYLEKYRGQKIFAYIAANTSNHFPFYDDEKRRAFPQFARTVPFPEASNLKERVANTTFLQDRFFGDLYRRFVQEGYSKDSHMVVFGDHSWPIGVHAGNVHSENQAFQENFMSALAIIPAELDRRRYRAGTQIDHVYSYLDLLPAVLDLYGISNFRYYGHSFLTDLSNQSPNRSERCVVAVQPFGGGYIAVVEYPRKYIFKLADNTMTSYDLSRDPDEAHPLGIKNADDRESLGVLDSCLRSLGR